MLQNKKPQKHVASEGETTKDSQKADWQEACNCKAISLTDNKNMKHLLKGYDIHVFSTQKRPKVQKLMKQIVLNNS